ncbi:MAG: hypothetical protein Q8R02_03975 [Hyphomonadaceae bacterium]|nr:hypothetical protein [Hyphomonadaceae bacterium]
MTNADIRDRLLAERRPYNEVTTPEGAGVYAFFLSPRGLLLPIAPGAEGLLYIAASRDGHAARQQYDMPTADSPLRQTLAAVLRNHLGLHPAVTPSKAADSFGLPHDGETLLSRWMRANLIGSAIAAESDNHAKFEAGLVAEMQPPLNLTGWENPQADLLRKFRATSLRLAEEAARAVA